MERGVRMAKRRITKAERERIQAVLDCLSEVYSKEYKCYLDHENALQLLIATMLSAQCTDERVNMVTKNLFKKYKFYDIDDIILNNLGAFIMYKILNIRDVNNLGRNILL